MKKLLSVLGGLLGKKTFTVVIDEEHGYRYWLWEFSGTERQLLETFNSNKPKNCLIEPTVLPGKVKECSAERYLDCDYHAHWHEPDDSVIEKSVPHDVKTVETGCGCQDDCGCDKLCFPSKEEAEKAAEYIHGCNHAIAKKVDEQYLKGV